MLSHSELDAINKEYEWSDDHWMNWKNPDSSLKVRIWEFTVFLIVIQSVWYWYRYCRTKFTLGIYLGYCFAFGWTWLIDMPFFLRLDFHPRSFGGFVIAHHWEPIWTAFSYSALGMPVLLLLNSRKYLKPKIGRGIYFLFAFGLPIPIMIYEGLLGCRLLEVEHYNWKPQHMLLGVPWTNTFVLEPLMILLPVFFIEQVDKLLSTVDERIMLGDEAPEEIPLFTGSWQSFWLGMASVHAGLYFTCMIMIPFLEILQPWTDPAMSN